MEKSKQHPLTKVVEEVRQSAGQQAAPERITDEELKLIALNGLMQSDPERAIPILDKLLQSNNSSKLKDKALFILAQSQSTQSSEILTRVARNGGDPDLQRRAVRYLGINGGDRNRDDGNRGGDGPPGPHENPVGGVLIVVQRQGQERMRQVGDLAVPPRCVRTSLCAFAVPTIRS